MRRILVPTDFSDAAERALEFALWVAGAVGANGVDVLHVHPRAGMYRPLESAMGVRCGVTDSLELSIRDSAELQLEVFLGRLGIADRRRIESVIDSGEAAEVIVERTRRDDCDLVVMGTAGRTGARHFLLGSIAERVIRCAGCPVVTVR